ncbi:MAG: hypothetical protein K2X55_24865 [Burkholderiaceae bacterium]|nr:hypothetical protein [Burkholderiaceae bacterium]
MSSRDVEAALLSRCADVAQERVLAAGDQREANVFRLAAMVVQSRFPRQSQRLMRVSEQYFVAHPNERLPAAEVVAKGWVSGLPRLRDMLTHQFHVP